MNKEAILAVADVIEYFGPLGKFNLGQWVGDKEHTHTFGGSGYKMVNILNSGDLWNKCGTAGCIAGWVVAWADIKLEDPYLNERELMAKVAEELGLTLGQTRTLCMSYSFWGDWLDKITWEQAVAKLRDIANGKVTIPTSAIWGDPR